MALRYKQIFPTVIIEVHEADAPARMHYRHGSDSRGSARVGKRPVTGVFVDRVTLIRQIGDHQVGPPVIVVVGEVYAHASVSLPVIVESDFRGKPHFAELSAAIVVRS